MKKLLAVLALALSVNVYAFEMKDCEVKFSPNGGVADMITGFIDSAQSKVRVLAYSFTRLEIAESLVNAKKRGVDVRAVLDQSNDGYRYSKAPLLIKAGIPTFYDRKHAIMHNKVIIIDDNIIMTGSYNFSGNAEWSNGENYIKCVSPDAASFYDENYGVHEAHSDRAK